MRTVEVLRGARRLLSDEKRWTKGGCARDKDGHWVHSGSRSAVCWCLGGAVFRAEEDVIAMMGALDALEAEAGQSPIGVWNDAPERTHAEVVELLDRVIAKLEAA